MIQEQTRPTAEAGPSGGGIDNFYNQDASPGMANILAGPYGENVPVAGMTVGEIRARFRDRFDIDPQSQAVIDGSDVGDDEVVNEGQTLMFTYRAGEKGAYLTSWAN
ncbi:MAG: hypothetical protein AAGH89_03010 [Verrucomicrobiota bacterium]